MPHNQELTKQRRAFEGERGHDAYQALQLKDQLMAVKTNKEYTAMLHEIHAAEEQIRHQEDKILEIHGGNGIARGRPEIG